MLEIKQIIENALKQLETVPKKNKRKIDSLINPNLEKLSKLDAKVVHDKLKNLGRNYEAKLLSQEQKDKLVTIIYLLIENTQAKLTKANNDKIQSKVVYYQGFIEFANKFISLFKVTQSLTDKDYIDYLEISANKFEKQQIAKVGFVNTTGKPNLDACFLLGKIQVANRIKVELINLITIEVNKEVK